MPLYAAKSGPFVSEATGSEPFLISSGSWPPKRCLSLSPRLPTVASGVREIHFFHTHISAPTCEECSTDDYFWNNLHFIFKLSLKCFKTYFLERWKKEREIKTGINERNLVIISVLLELLMGIREGAQAIVGRTEDTCFNLTKNDSN